MRIVEMRLQVAEGIRVHSGVVTVRLHRDVAYPQGLHAQRARGTWLVRMRVKKGLGADVLCCGREAVPG